MARGESTEVLEIAERVLGEGTFSVEKFVESFGVLVEATEGTSSLRRMVRGLGARGWLTQRRPPDAAADDGDWPFKTPNDWTWRRVADFAELADGPFGSKLKSEHYVAEPSFRVLRLGNIGLGEFKDLDQAFIRRQHYESLVPYHLLANDILVASLGNPPGRSCLVPGDALPAVNKADCFRIRIRWSGLLPAFLVLALNSDFTLNRAVDLHRGDTRGRITLSHLRDTPIPIPPLAEQKRIVARVGQLMALIDQLEAKQNRKRDLGARFTNASLEALTTAESPQEFSTAWTRIQSTWPTLLDSADKVPGLRRLWVDLGIRGWLTGEPQAYDSADFASSPFPISGDGKWRRLHECAELADGPFGSKLKSEHYVAEPSYRVLRLGNIGLGEFKDADRSFISRQHYESLAPCHLEPNDILVASLGNPPGRSCLVPGDVLPAINKADCFRIRITTKALLPEFLALVLNSGYALLRAADLNRGDTRGRITLSHLRQTPIPIPPLAEQKRIVAKVEHLMKLCDALEAALRRSEDRAAKLAEAVVQEMVA